METFSFEKLNACLLAEDLVSEVYLEISRFPNNERYSLSNQLHRAIISVTSNIAEGCGRKSLKEKIHFIEIAYGSLLEAFSQLRVACKIGYTSRTRLDSFRTEFFKVARLLQALRQSYLDVLDNQS